MKTVGRKPGLPIEPIAALAIWAVIIIIQGVIVPAFAPTDWSIEFNEQSLFQASWHGLSAFLVAFPVADRLLSAKRYFGYAIVAIVMLIASAAALEFIVAPALFGALVFPVAVYFNFAESAAITTIFLVLRLLFHRYRNEARIADLERTRLDAELKYLKAQINPHFLFNALNNVYSHALRSAPETPQLILQLSDMLRYTTYDSADADVPLDKELAFIADYVAIQEMALEGRGKVNISVEGETHGRRIAPLLLIPFVENCFKHSLATVERNISIDISIHVKNTCLLMTCVNSYETRNRDRRDPASGLGVENARRRLELLFGDDFELSVSQSNDLFEVHLEVPTTL